MTKFWVPGTGSSVVTEIYLGGSQISSKSLHLSGTHSIMRKLRYESFPTARWWWRIWTQLADYPKLGLGHARKLSTEFICPGQSWSLLNSLSEHPSLTHPIISEDTPKEDMSQGWWAYTAHKPAVAEPQNSNISTCAKLLCRPAGLPWLHITVEGLVELWVQMAEDMLRGTCTGKCRSAPSLHGPPNVLCVGPEVVPRPYLLSR